jgi:hypothetical protein
MECSDNKVATKAIITSTPTKKGLCVISIRINNCADKGGTPSADQYKDKTAQVKPLVC